MDTALVAIRVVVAAYLYDALPKHEGLNAYLAHSTYKEMPKGLRTYVFTRNVGDELGDESEELNLEEGGGGGWDLRGGEWDF